MQKKAFTLIELLVVIAIIGLLASMAVIALNNARMKARDARRLADVSQMQTAIEMYYVDNYGYPAAGSAWKTPATLCLSSSGWAVTCGATTYMGVAPTAPTPVENGCTSTDNSYSYSGTATNYSLKYCLGSVIGDVSAGVHTASATGLSY